MKPSNHDHSRPISHSEVPPSASLAPVEGVSGKDIREDLSQLMGAKVQEEVALPRGHDPPGQA